MEERSSRPSVSSEGGGEQGRQTPTINSNEQEHSSNSNNGHQEQQIIIEETIGNQHQSESESHSIQHEDEQQEGSIAGGKQTTDTSRSSETAAAKPNKRFYPISRRKATPEQTKILEAAFEINKLPKTEEREILANQIGIPVKAVQFWFQNRRAKEQRMKKDGNGLKATGNHTEIHIHGRVTDTILLPLT